ncbi:DNA ligase/mRNA capping enzyme, partial [Gloeophyllum trabeum ATCC 11539]
HPVSDIFRRWAAQLTNDPRSLPAETTSVIFLLLFPEEDVCRKYDLQETKLAQYLLKIFPSTSTDIKRRLTNWNVQSSNGCLGNVVKDVLESISYASIHLGLPPLSVLEFATLLDKLAATSAFSDRSIRSKHDRKHRGTRLEILSSIYRRLDPTAAAFVTQIILKDLRPLLYPLQATHYTAALTEYNSNAITPLSKEDAMRIWDPTGAMLRAYRCTNSFEDASRAFHSCTPYTTGTPQIGTPIQIPKCRKGQGCAHALQVFQPSDRVWAETKYDGERAQIHVQIRDGKPWISIFSKSKRDSTLDRAAIHPIIHRVLGIEEAGNVRLSSPKIRRNIVLEAEMVAYSEEMDKIDEFWRIRDLIESTAVGVRGRPRTDAPLSDSQTSSTSDNSTRHLALIFFDVLILESVSLLSAPYATRRDILESLITPIPGYAMLAERTLVSPDGIAEGGDAEERLRSTFARLLSEREEGIVLKAERGLYNEYRSPWVKLKKDYIPGYGDAVDLVLLAARWDKDRGRELRVSPGTYTTFYLGALTNAAACQSKASTKPDFRVLFTVSYGLTREQLEHLNFRIRSAVSVEYREHTADQLSYTFVMPKGIPAPEVILEEPLVAEVFGAGFTKEHSNKYYELRFPRMTKVYRRQERSWEDATDLHSYQKIAFEAVGKDRPNKDVDDWCKSLWGQPVSPAASCPLKRKRTEEIWKAKLAASDQRTRSRKKLRSDADDETLRQVDWTVSSTKRSRPGLKPLASVTNLNQRP